MLSRMLATMTIATAVMSVACSSVPDHIQTTTPPKSTVRVIAGHDLVSYKVTDPGQILSYKLRHRYTIRCGSDDYGAISFKRLDDEATSMLLVSEKEYVSYRDCDVSRSDIRNIQYVITMYPPAHQ